MKRVYILILLFYTPGVEAQTYRSVVANNDSMHILFDSGLYEGLTQVITLNRDTVIEGINYKFIDYPFIVKEFFHEEICSFENLEKYNHECIQTMHYDLLLGEDSTYSKLYLFSLRSDARYTIMDLTLEKDDTFHLSSIPYIVDTVYYKDDNKTIQFKYPVDYISHGKIPLQFIEGTGSNQGPFYGFNNFKDLLLCSYKDGVETFKISNDSGCDIGWFGDDNLVFEPIGIEKDETGNEFMISTGNGKLNIKPSSLDKYRVLVFDLQGITLYAAKHVSGEHSIPVLYFGTLIVKIIQNDQITTSKIIP